MASPAVSLLLFLFLSAVLHQCVISKNIKVAVYEHEVFSQDNPKFVLDKADARLIAGKNLEIFATQAANAVAQDAKLIVFPENGIYGSHLNRDSIAPFLEDIPDPNNVRWCPCKSPDKNLSSYFIQKRLSCIAQNNGIYVAATAADVKPCSFAPPCPKDNDRYHFNTAVVYDRFGCLVVRYHKQHLFYEEAFDTPKVAEYATFSIANVKFGVSICFDLLFKTPATELITKKGASAVVFPTAWTDQLPLLSAISYHSSWAMGLDATLLAANLYRPSADMSGSGIYGPDGPLAYVCQNGSEAMRLLVAEIPERPVRSLVTPTPLNISMGELMRRVDESSYNFKSNVFHDQFKFVPMRGRVGFKKVCEHNFCCYLRYEMEKYFEDELYAFGAFSDLHTFEGTYFIQVCVVLRCRLSDLHFTCGEPVDFTTTRFSYLYIDGTFNSSATFPIVLTSNMTLPEPGEVQISNFPFPFLESKNGISRPLLTAAIFTRLYDHDGSTIRGDMGPSAILSFSLVALLALRWFG